MDNDFFPPSDDRLNVQALRAAWGYSSDYVGALSELLLSFDTPLHRTLREALAQALLGTSPTGVTLTMQGHEQKRARNYETRLKWMEIGQFITAHIGETPKHGARTAALKAAVAAKNASYRKCEDSLEYYQKVRAWVESVHIPDTAYGRYSEAELEQRYHGFALDDQYPPPNRKLPSD